MAFSLTIANGRVIEPSQKKDNVQILYTKRKKMVEIPEKDSLAINAKDFLITPGLVDAHTHVFYGGSELGMNADPSCIPMGVTTAIDAGSSGVFSWGALMENCIALSTVKIYAALNVISTGSPTLTFLQNSDPQYFDSLRLNYIKERYPEKFKAVFLQLSKSTLENMAVRPLDAALKIADELKLPLVVYVDDPPVDAGYIASSLRPGDIFSLLYMPGKNGILDDNGKVKEHVFKAQERGVLFDTASSFKNTSFAVIKKTLEQGFYPDIISSDSINPSIYQPNSYGLPFILSYMWEMGMELPDLIKAATSSPAAAFNLPGVGSLAAGNFADLAIFKIVEKPATIKDSWNNQLAVNKWLVPMLTTVEGKIAWRNMLFALAE